MKKILAILMTFMLTLTGCSIAEGYEENDEYGEYNEDLWNDPKYHRHGNYVYEIMEDGSASICDWHGDETYLEIPSELDGYTVTRIGDYGLSSGYALSYVKFPDTLRSLGECVLSGNEYIDTIDLPESLSEIAINPFEHCYGLRSINASPDNINLASIDGVLFSKADKRLVSYPIGLEDEQYSIPNGIRIIGERAFSSCKLQSIYIPDTVIEIEENAFCFCSELRAITLPESLESIGKAAFNYCSQLTAVTLPDSIEQIGGNPFVGCYAMSKVSVSPEHPYLATIDGVLFSKPEKRLLWFPASSDIQDYSVPQGIKEIGDSSFLGCSSLHTLHLPDSVITIEDGAFWDMDELTNITLLEGVTSIGANAFTGCYNLESINVPSTVSSIGDGAFMSCGGLSSFVWPEGVTTIGSDMFADCWNLQSLTIPASVKEIADYTFPDYGECVINVERDSYAAEYCKKFGYKYTYPDADDWLN